MVFIIEMEWKETLFLKEQKEILVARVKGSSFNQELLKKIND